MSSSSYVAVRISLAVAATALCGCMVAASVISAERLLYPFAAMCAVATYTSWSRAVAISGPADGMAPCVAIFLLLHLLSAVATGLLDVVLPRGEAADALFLLACASTFSALYVAVVGVWTMLGGDIDDGKRRS